MSFFGACGLARMFAITGCQLRTGLATRNQQQMSAFCSSSSVEPKQSPKPASGNSAQDANSTANIGSRTHKPDNFEKRLLVFTKKYKSVDDVPAYINQDVMERCRNQVRIKMANYMMLATVIGCIIMIISGKKAQERGDSVQKMNLDWHKEYNEKAKKEIAEASQK